MIVTLNFPTNISSIQYGVATLMPDSVNHTLDIPAYVAKTLLTLPGVTGPTLSETALQLLGETPSGEEFEANYIFIAYGQPIPLAGQVSSGIALMTARGEPSVSMS